jgi:carboxymethylenebutenolidase
MSRDTPALSPHQQAMVELWDKHMRYEFDTHSVQDTMDTMVEFPINVNVPVMTGGVGYQQVQQYYADHFITRNPPDAQITLVTRTVGSDRIVDEMVMRFTHSLEMDWMLPGIQPTGRVVEVAIVAIVQFQDGLIASEHIYWDQASVLAQVGLLETRDLPVVGADSARKVLDPVGLPTNELIPRTIRP